MDRAAHAMLTAGVTTVFHPLVYAKTLIQVLKVTLKHGLYPPPLRIPKVTTFVQCSGVINVPIGVVIL